jgi:mono/diheme cytochrome c family protein
LGIGSTIVLMAGVVASAASASAVDAHGPEVLDHALAQRGAALAELWCNSCHITDAGRSEDPMSQSPSFRQLATRVETQAAGFRATLSAPHYPMRAVTLSPGEIEAIIAYIRSLSSNEQGQGQ